MENRLCFPFPPDRLVRLLKGLKHLKWRSFGGSALKDGVRRILNGKLDLLSSRISSQERDQHQRRIQPSCHTGSADKVAIYRYPRIHKDRSVIPHELPGRSRPGTSASFSETAKVLNLTPSGKSRTVANVESWFRTKLFINHIRLLMSDNAMANWILWHVKDATELHEIIAAMPAYPWFEDVEIIALAGHPVDPLSYELSDFSKSSVTSVVPRENAT